MSLLQGCCTNRHQGCTCLRFGTDVAPVGRPCSKEGKQVALLALCRRRPCRRRPFLRGLCFRLHPVGGRSLLRGCGLAAGVLHVRQWRECGAACLPACTCCARCFGWGCLCRCCSSTCIMRVHCLLVTTSVWVGGVQDGRAVRVPAVVRACEWWSVGFQQYDARCPERVCRPQSHACCVFATH